MGWMNLPDELTFLENWHVEPSFANGADGRWDYRLGREGEWTLVSFSVHAASVEIRGSAGRLCVEGVEHCSFDLIRNLHIAGRSGSAEYRLTVAPGGEFDFVLLDGA